MCGGIAGIRAPLARDELERRVVRMMDALVHRGPDGSGVWRDDTAGLVLGHRRLAIVDLSAFGAQPMVSAGGRFVIAYNGELYYTYKLRLRRIDSSTVVALIQRTASPQVRSFSVGFDISAFNEAEMARCVAKALGTKHSEPHVTEREALDCIQNLTSIYDQPHADPSAILTYLLYSDFNEIMMYHDTMTYLADGVLAKVDRASIGSSLEARVPLLDHRVMEQAWRLPSWPTVIGATSGAILVCTIS